MASIEDRIPSLSGKKTATFRADDVKASAEFRKAYTTTHTFALYAANDEFGAFAHGIDHMCKPAKKF